jgi:hypothetical protein
MTQQEALGYITEMLQKAVANKIYSGAEIFAINQSISKLQQDEHSQNKGQHSDASAQTVTTN